MNTDQSLSDDAPTSPAEPPTSAPDGAFSSTPQQMTIEEVLESAERVEKVASICLKANLQAEYDALLAELALLVDDRGEVLDQDAAVGESTAAARAAELNEQLTAVRRRMSEAMWSVRFRAMDSDAWDVFLEAHLPKKPDADMRPFYNLLLAECAIAPTLTLDQVEQLRKKLGSRQITKLVSTAWAANTQDGLDVPK